MPDYEVDVTVSFEVNVVARDCDDVFEAEEQGEAIVAALIDKSGIPADAWPSVEAWQTIKIEKGGE